MMASSMTSSATSLAPASIMQTFLSVPATTRVRSLSLRCSAVGVRMISPSTRPTLMPAMGPFQGMSEMARAKEAPIIPAISG